MAEPTMAEEVAVFDLGENSPAQRHTHAHLRGDAIHFHVHAPGEEPGKPEALVLSKWDLWRVMDVNYWKKEASLEFEGGEGTNVTGAEVGLRKAVFRWKKGNREAEDEISFPALRQVDARLRRRVRDVRGLAEEELAGLPPGAPKAHEAAQESSAEAE